MSKIEFKACPKCQGDVFLENDVFGGWYQRCLQCGHTRYLNTIVNTRESSIEKAAQQKIKVTCV